MPTFKNLDDLVKYLKKHPEEILKHADKDYLTLPCPVCDSEQKMKNLRNGKVKCLKCNNEINLNINVK